jgi:xylulokinase
VSKQASSLLGIPTGAVVSYRAGDQPNNALSLNVLEPGEIASTAGTSGVVYAVSGELEPDPQSRINSFAHVNHMPDDPHIGILLCVNGTGIANSWSRRITGHAETPYPKINEIAANSPVGSAGIVFLPFGNGAERMFGDRIVGSHFLNIDFTRHTVPDILRSVQEGIAFSLVYGIRLMNSLGVHPSVIRAGGGNMFLSPLFCEALASASGIPIEIYSTDGAQGAARGAAAGAGAYGSLRDAATGLRCEKTIEPSKTLSRAYADAMSAWNEALTPALEYEPR